jgi:toxin secretion/phage lysis holin
MQTSDAGWAHLPSAWQWMVGVIAAWWVSTPATMQVLIMLMGIDYASGVLGALAQGQFCARAGWRGLVKKVLTLLLLGTVWLVTRPMNLGFDVAAAGAMAFAFNELCSIVQNCADAGVDIPDPFVVALVKMKRLTGRSRTAAEVEKAFAAAVGDGTDKGAK